MSRSKTRLRSRMMTLLLLSWAVVPLAHAQFAVIDIASVTQLIEQAETLEQQLAEARAQFGQAQAQFRSMTGSRGMQQLLAGTVRNYLPANGAELDAVLQGASSSYGTLAADIQRIINANAQLSASQLALLPPDERRQIGAARQTMSMLQALTQSALVNSSNRFASLQQLIDAIPGATDQKAILELQARIGAEQGMLQNEQTKLQVLYQSAQAQELINRQREQELIVAGQGRFETRFEPSPR